MLLTVALGGVARCLQFSRKTGSEGDDVLVVELRFPAPAADGCGWMREPESIRLRALPQVQLELLKARWQTCPEHLQLLRANCRPEFRFWGLSWLMLHVPCLRAKASWRSQPCMKAMSSSRDLCRRPLCKAFTFACVSWHLCTLPFLNQQSVFLCRTVKFPAAICTAGSNTSVREKLRARPASLELDERHCRSRCHPWHGLCQRPAPSQPNIQPLSCWAGCAKMPKRRAPAVA